MPTMKSTREHRIGTDAAEDRVDEFDTYELAYGDIGSESFDGYFDPLDEPWSDWSRSQTRAQLKRILDWSGDY